MDEDLRKKIQEFEKFEASPALRGRILLRVEKLERRRAKSKMFFSYSVTFVSAVSSFSALYIFGKTFVQSEFWYMLSLVASDFALVLNNWQPYVFSLLETFPVMHAVAMLVPIFILLFSISAYLDSQGNYNHKFI